MLHALASLAQPILVVDLATAPLDDGRLLRVLGAHPQGGDFGLPVAGGYDLDGDGFEDYAVASPVADPGGRTDAGEIALVFGDGTIGGEIDLADAQARVLVIRGDQTRETAGNTIWIDDVTGDDIGDLLICRQNFTHSGRTGTGALTILAGGPELRTFAAALQPFDLRTPDEDLTVTHVVGAVARDRFCVWARTGDVTGDGTAEILVGADQQDTADGNHTGGAYLLRGGPHLAAGGTLDLADLAAPALAGKVAHIQAPAGFSEHHMGATVLVADLDGNDKAEVLVAATLNRITQNLGPDPPDFGDPHHPSGGAAHGRVYVLWDDSFATPWSTPLQFEVDDPPGSLTTLQGATYDVAFGEDMLGGLDYDGDGDGDLFVGDLTADDTLGSRPQSGIGWVFYAAAGLKGQSIDLDTPPPGVTKVRGPVNLASYGAIGADTTLHGDYDGDGIADLTFCSPGADPLGRINAGTMHVLRGRLGGWPPLVDTALLPSPSQVQVVEIHGANGATVGGDDGDVLCYSAATGDVDGDGLADLVVNEMRANGSDPAAIDAGTLLVIRGVSLFVLFRDGFETGDTSRWSAAASAPPP